MQPVPLGAQSSLSASLHPAHIPAQSLEEGIDELDAHAGFLVVGYVEVQIAVKAFHKSFDLRLALVEDVAIPCGSPRRDRELWSPTVLQTSSDGVVTSTASGQPKACIVRSDALGKVRCALSLHERA